MRTPAEAAAGVAAYVTCHGGDIPGQGPCGLVPLTATDYEQQLAKPDNGWTCPQCGGHAEYHDTESERVHGVYDEQPAAAPSPNPAGVWADVSPERRAKLLSEIEAAIDEPVPEGMFERANAVMAATLEERRLLVWNVLLTMALFIDDTQVDHPEFDPVAIRRAASDSMARALMILVRSARLGESRELNPARAAVATYFIAEEVLEVALKGDKRDGFPNLGEPGSFRAFLEAEGLTKPREKAQVPA